MERRGLGTYEGASGFILDWMICGFFPNGTVPDSAPNLFDPKRSRHWSRDYLKPYGGATAIRGAPRSTGKAAVEWLALRGEERSPKIWLQAFLRANPELARAFPGEAHWDHQWYALAFIESDHVQAAELRLCGQDGCQVWWNGKFIFEEHAWHKLAFDLHTLPVQLKKGRNTLLLKLDRFGLLARITAPGGAKLAGKVHALSATEPRPKPPGTLEQLERYAKTLRVTHPCRAKTSAEYRIWRAVALKHFRACLGPFPKFAPMKPRAQLIERVSCHGYARWHYQLEREAGSVLSVHVLVPDQNRFNGRTVICPHGHGQDEQVVAGIQPPAKPYGNWYGTFTGNYAEQLAQAGFITATWSARAMSSATRDTPAGSDPCNFTALCASALGLTLPGLHIFDLHGVADFVATLPGVNSKRLGLMGLSGGGTLTYLGGAYDERFKAIGVFCGLLGYADYAAGEGCGMQIVPGLYPTMDVGEVLSLIAPRPLLIAQGRRDMVFNEFRTRRFAREAQRAYRVLGETGRVELCVDDLAHQVNIEAALSFFTRHL